MHILRELFGLFSTNRTVKPATDQDYKKGMLNLGLLHYYNANYKHASSNIGDYIQTLAAINIYRHFLGSNLPFTEFMKRAIENTIPGVNFVFLKRDNINKHALSGKVIAIINGWLMKPDETGYLDWPINDNIIPIFISIHIADKRMLTQKGIEYLKKYEPIGCRDLATLKKLKDKGVKAYFSGCLTSTIDFLHHTSDAGPWYFVDAPIENTPGNPKYKTMETSHYAIVYKNQHYSHNLYKAYDFLKKYSLSSGVTTSRLHCYLPCRAMGVPVKFHQEDSTDDRFGGLIDVDFNDMRDDMLRDSLNRLSQLIPYWKHESETINICFCFDQNWAKYLPVVVNSIKLNNKNKNIRLHLIRPPGTDIPTLKGVEVISYPAIWEKEYSGLKHVTSATMLRLLAPQLIKEDIKLLYLDIDVIVNMNLAPIFNTKLGSTGIAMKTSIHAGKQLIRDIGANGKKLENYPWGRSGNAGVILMDLATLRKNKFTEFCINYPDKINDQLIINMYLKGDYTELDKAYNLYVSQDANLVEKIDDFIIHYIGPNKPWCQDKPDYWRLWDWYAKN